MKNVTFLLSLLVVSISALAAPKSSTDHSSSVYAKPIIFVEGGVEFAVYPDGQFDFFYNPQRSGYGINVISPNVNISYNSGYNYDPYIQYDDYGAVIQVENVPIYYDYYGRISRAGNLNISYNHFGKIVRVGGLRVFYNPYNQISHYNGYINVHNRIYVARPWHHYYRQPYSHHSVVYHQPYRAYYQPARVTYNYQIDYYQNNHNKPYKKSYYKPGDKAVVYHRGQRTEQVRDIRESSSSSNETVVRSNMNTQRRTSTTTPVQRAQAAPDTRSVAKSSIPTSGDTRSSTRSEMNSSRTNTVSPERASTRRSVSPNNKSSVQPESQRPTSTAQRSSSRSTVNRAAAQMQKSPSAPATRATTTNSNSRSARGRG